MSFIQNVTSEDLFLIHLRIVLHNLVRLKQFQKESGSVITSCSIGQRTEQYLLDVVKGTYANLVIYTFEKVCLKELSAKYWWMTSRIGIENDIVIDLTDPQHLRILEEYSSVRS